MNKSISRIIVVTFISGVTIILISLLFTRVYTLNNLRTYNELHSSKEDIIPGIVNITLKPYTSINVLDEYLKQYPEVTRKTAPGLHFSSFGTFTLKGHQAITQKALSLGKNADKDPEIIAAEHQLQINYDRMKTNSLLADSNIWNTLPYGLSPEQKYFGVIHYFFKEGVTRSEREQFFSSYPDLEVVEDREESQTYTITVPTGKEDYWRQQLSIQPFAQNVYLEYVGHIRINNPGSLH